jgi:hypothetical protein
MAEKLRCSICGRSIESHNLSELRTCTIASIDIYLDEMARRMAGLVAR